MLSNEKPYKFSFDKFPLIINDVIVLPKKTLLFRGYHVDSDPIGDTARHYSTMDVAKIYAEQDTSHKFGVFVTSKPIKLLDLRFIIMLLREFMNHPLNTLDPIILKPLTVSYGLCSLARQIELLDELPNITEYAEYDNFKKFYVGLNPLIINKNINPVEHQGVRIGITNIDVYSILFLTNLFREYDIDGFIAPQLFSPFHHQNRNREEIVLFNPLKSGILLLPSDRINLKKIENMPSVKIQDFIGKNVVEFLDDQEYTMDFLAGGGGGSLKPLDYDINTYFEKSPSIPYLQNLTKTAVLGINKYIKFGFNKAPKYRHPEIKPSVDISPWLKNSL
jgi:hypothetical protein